VTLRDFNDPSFVTFWEMPSCSAGSGAGLSHNSTYTYSRLYYHSSYVSVCKRNLAILTYLVRSVKQTAVEPVTTQFSSSLIVFMFLNV